MQVRTRIILAMTAVFLGCGDSAVAQPQTSSATVTADTAASASGTASADSRQAAIAALLKPIEGVTYLPNSVIGMVLSTADKDQRIEPIAGSLGSTNVWVSVLFFADFPGQHANVSISDARPAVHIKLGSNPDGRLFLVKAKVNADTNNRSVKLGKSGFARFTAATTPDKDWVIPSTVKEDGPGMWTLTPTADLAPGEYGVFVINGTGGGSSGDLYGFAVAAK